MTAYNFVAQDQPNVLLGHVGVDFQCSSTFSPLQQRMLYQSWAEQNFAMRFKSK